jgi:hypothetical protein
MSEFDTTTSRLTVLSRLAQRIYVSKGDIRMNSLLNATSNMRSQAYWVVHPLDDHPEQSVTYQPSVLWQ